MKITCLWDLEGISCQCDFILFYFLWETWFLFLLPFNKCVLCVCVCMHLVFAHHMLAEIIKNPRLAGDFLPGELQVASSQLLEEVGVTNQTEVLWKNSACS